MSERSTAKPFAAGTGAFTPLEALVRSALRRAGNFSVARVDGETMMMFIELANMVVEDVRRHPYWTGGDLDYYTDTRQHRPVPDGVMIHGLAAYYMIQQGSEKSQLYLSMYQARMTDLLYERMYGNRPLERRIMDGGSDPLLNDTPDDLSSEGY